MFRVNETRTSNVNRVIIIPYGYNKNFSLSEAQRGDVIIFKDGRKSVIEDICNVWTASPIFSLLCHMVYGLTPEMIIKDWRKKYKNDIQYDQALIITYNTKFIKEENVQNNT